MAGGTQNEIFITASDLKDVLECPVCLRVPRSAPVYQCERGHVVCKDCHPKLSTCPVCRLPLGKTRSLISEKVLTKLPSPCKYAEQGCRTECLSEVLERHEKDCSFRLVECVDLACGQAVALNKLMEHVAKDHEREDFVNADGASYKSHFIVHEEDFNREIMWISDNLQLEGRNFFRECCRSPEGLWYIWVYMVGSLSDAQQYKCTIKITSSDKSEELAFKGRVTSIDVPKIEVSKSCLGLVFPDSTAKLYWEDSKIHYSVSVEAKHRKHNSGAEKVNLTEVRKKSEDEDKAEAAAVSAEAEVAETKKDKKKKSKSVKESSC